jgi:hypothetical protein
MEQGYVYDDKGPHGGTPSQWVEGPPVQGFWLGMKIPKGGRHAITTYRCTACGYLESYADESDED